MAKFVKEIRWREGFHNHTEAVDAYNAIEKLRKANGGHVEPEKLVDAAKTKTHPLHPEFIWDDKQAAELHRIDRARLILRSIVVLDGRELKGDPRRVYEVSELPATTDRPSRKVYQTVEDIMADPVAREELLERAKAELRSFRKRYAQLKELAGLMRSIDRVVAA